MTRNPCLAPLCFNAPANIHFLFMPSHFRFITVC